MEIRDKILSEYYGEFIYPEFNPGNRVYERYNAEFSQPISNTDSTLYLPLTDTDNFNFSNYTYGMIPKILGLMDTSPLEVSGITRLANQPALSLRGQGTIIGIIDTGIDYLNPAFMDENGNTRILRIWDQSSNEGRLPATLQEDILVERLNLNINYGSEYTEEDINRAIQSDDPYSIVGQRDEIGHGTFLAGVAGGTPNIQNDFSGAATEAKFIVVKLKQAKSYLRKFYFIPEDVPAYQNNDIVIAANYIRMYSEIFQMPVALLVALGTSQGSHKGRSILSRELSSYVNNIGTAVVVAAGNEGNARHHYQGNLKNRSQPEEVEIRVDENNPGFSMEIWVSAPQVFSLGVVSPTGEVVERIPARIGNSQIVDFIFEKTRLYVEYDIVEGQTGDELILIRFREPTAGIWRIRLYGNNVNSGVFNCWLPISQFVGDGTYFLKSDPSVTITNPGMADNVITIAAYNSSNGAYFQDSGRGFSRDGRVKPDITSPGVGITGPTLTGGFENRDGTSYGAAITTGACSQILTWGIVNGNRSYMSTTDVKSYLIRGARREEGYEYPNNEWGYGKLDVYNVFEVLRNS
ncbi:MAG: S8 family peptidase [Lachnospiraceae bacterium]